jgi:tetratricopeptide (TPR) repeat protein
MKRTERRHLKDNELADLALTVRERIEANKTRVLAGFVGVVVIVGSLIGYSTWRGRAQARVGTVLAEAMAVQQARVGPPEAPGSSSGNPSYPTERDRSQAALEKFKLVADEFPDTEQGRYARYREAGLHLALGNVKDAAAVYQRVIDQAGETLYGQMARLGLAEAQARSGEYDKAIEAYKGLAERKDGPLPLDGVLMQLGRTYLGAGQKAEAQQAFTRLVDEFPQSPFAGDARRELDVLKKG